MEGKVSCLGDCQAIRNTFGQLDDCERRAVGYNGNLTVAETKVTSLGMDRFGPANTGALTNAKKATACRWLVR